jgi:hypothetical protein
MSHFKYFVSLIIILALSLVFIGCAKPPEAEKSAAKVAMDAAVSAGADKYAIADFEAANKLWDTSEAQVNEKNYKEAKQGYINAKAAFEKAAGAVEAAKKAMEAEVTPIVAGLEEGWNNLQVAAKNVEEDLMDKKEAWEADSKSFTEGLAAARGMIATDPAGAKMKAGELKSVIDKWDATFKELAAAAAAKKAEAAKKKGKAVKKSKK